MGKQLWAKNKADIGNLDTARLVFATEGTYHDGQLISTFSGLKYADTDADGNFTPPSGLTHGTVYEVAVFPLAGDTKRVQKIIGGWTYELPEGENIHELTELSAAPASGDELLIYDADAAAEKKITAANLLSNVNAAIGTLASLTTSVTSDLVSAVNEVDGHCDGKPDKVGTSVVGNLVAFSSVTGDQADSGSKPADFEAAGTCPAKVGTSVVGNFVSFSSVTGDQADSGAKPADFEPADAAIQSHIGTTTGNPHSVTAAEAGAPALVNPSVIDNFVAFSDVAGGQKDSGLSKSDLGNLIVNPSVADNIPAFNGIAGELKDSGIAKADIVQTSDLAAYTDNKVQEGLYVVAKGTPDLNINHSAGFSKIDGVLKYTEAKTTDGLAITAATAGNKKTAIVQIAKTTGTVSIKESTPIALGATPCTRPTPDADNIVVANLFGLTDADAILEATSAVTNADIDNSAGSRF